MGVTGLWKLIEASGKPVPLETLENKVLAIDISIWLHQVVKGYQDNKGGHLPNAHLLGLFNRVCKLLYFRIKPVFVFDGGVPELKRKTIAKRSQQKTKIQSEAERLEKLLLETLVKENIVKQAIGDPDKILSPSKIQKQLKAIKSDDRDDIYKLPPINEDETREVKTELEDDESDEDLCPKRSYDVNINQIDVNCPNFKSLPADIRHDILTDIKETRKQNSWGRLRELPVVSDEFSSYQMSRLLKRRQVQVRLEEAEKEMGGKCWSLSELESLMSEEGVLDIDKKAQKIASNEHTRFLLVRDIANAMKEAKQEDVAGPSTSKFKSHQPQPSTSTQIDEPDDDEDLDLQKAIQLSLLNGGDEVVQPEGARKLNPEQRQKFSGTIQAHGLIKGFMMEYAEMNSDDVQDLMEATQSTLPKDELNDSFREKFPHTDDYVLYGTPKKKKDSTEAAAMSDSDDDLIDVPVPSKETADEKIVISLETSLKDYSQEEDLFADVFKSDKEIPEVPDVEVASISSDDDTIPYEVSQDIEDVEKEVESGFVSEATEKSLESSTAPVSVMMVDETDEFTASVNETDELAASENEKFWGVVDEPIVEKQPEVLSENEMFWKIADEEADSTSPAIVSSEISTLDNIPTVTPSDQKLLETTNDDVIEIIDDREKVQKTPTKANRENSPPPSKVASPFFVNRKTPKSKKKENQDSNTDQSSVVKSLFTEEMAVQELRQKNTSEELQQMKYQLADEQKNLSNERNRMDRMGRNITQSMAQDCKELLKLFGIPFIVSPMEAEAQCAFLNMINLTDGTISDDSDMFLFGGQTVYKNFFVQKKIVMEFQHQNIEQMFHLDRKKMIQLAMLVGSDYTIGINGIGAVTALEILAAFPTTLESEDGTDQYQSLVSSLRKFREWFNNGKQAAGGKNVLKSKLKNVELFEDFPSLNVARAYLEPMVDTNAEEFSWGTPDTESLVEYAKAKLGWTRMKTEEILAPVMKKLNEKKQSTIKDYFKSQVSKKFYNNNVLSKRVQKAIGKMGGEEDDKDEEEKPKKTRKRKAPVKKKEEVGSEEPICLSSENEEVPEKKKSPEPSTSKSQSIPKKEIKPKATKRKQPANELQQPSTSSLDEEAIFKKRAPRIPNTKQVIPQREKDEEKQEQDKKNAIEVFKKSLKK